MIDVKKDRQGYGDLLRAPAGYHVDAAIGTTYSMDIQTLLAVIIAMSEDQAIEHGELTNPVAILQAVWSMRGKVLVFCEAGQIKRPKEASPLYLLLESMIVQVTLRKRSERSGGGYPAFHAKTWTIRYVNAVGDYHYRFVTLSRNLTDDRSWDISIALDSSVDKHTEAKSAPIVDFLSYLRDKWTPAGKSRQMVSRMATEITNVSFATESHAFADDAFDFIPIGINDGKDAILKTPLFSKTYPYTPDTSFHHLIIFSPFLSPDLIRDWNDNNRTLSGTQRTLITRKTELTKLTNGDASHFKLYTLKDAVVDGEEMISNEDSEKFKQDIHAKMYLRQKANAIDLYVGSMNATNAAVHHNVEMMVHLHTTARYLTADSFLRELWGGNVTDVANPFEEVELSTDVKAECTNETTALEQQIKAICRLKLTAKASCESDGRWTLTLFCPKMPAFTPVMVRPMAVENAKELKDNVSFHGLSLLQLSAFWTITVHGHDTQVERVILIKTTGLPEKRYDEVIRSVIHDNHSFIEYLAFLLEDDYLVSLLEQRQNGNGRWNNQQLQQSPVLYEKLIKAALTSKEKLEEIRDFVTHLKDSDVIPKDFDELFSVVCDAAGVHMERR